jgi:predicted transcriptional regulator
MKTDENLEKILASKTQAKLLTFLFKNTSKQFYQREIVKELGESLSTIQYEIKRLTTLGLLKAETKDRKVYYTLDQTFYLYPELRSIVFKSIQKMI